MDERGALQETPSRSSAAVHGFKADLLAAGQARCQVCRWKPPVGLALLHDEPTSMLHAHHVIPIACRGADDARNLVLVCPTHHAIAHKLGRMERSNRWGKVWVGPRTPDELLKAIRLLERGGAGWAAYVEAGRSQAALEQAEADERRASIRIETTTKSTTRESDLKNGTLSQEAVSGSR